MWRTVDFRVALAEGRLSLTPTFRLLSTAPGICMSDTLGFGSSPVWNRPSTFGVVTPADSFLVHRLLHIGGTQGTVADRFLAAARTATLQLGLAWPIPDGSPSLPAPPVPAEEDAAEAESICLSI